MENMTNLPCSGKPDLSGMKTQSRHEASIKNVAYVVRANSLFKVLGPNNGLDLHYVSKRFGAHPRFNKRKCEQISVGITSLDFRLTIASMGKAISCGGKTRERP
jgi:hypothetical protein